MRGKLPFSFVIRMLFQKKIMPTERTPQLNSYNVMDKDEDYYCLDPIWHDLGRKKPIKVEDVIDEEMKREMKPSLKCLLIKNDTSVWGKSYLIILMGTILAKRKRE